MRWMMRAAVITAPRTRPHEIPISDPLPTWCLSGVVQIRKTKRVAELVRKNTNLYHSATITCESGHDHVIIDSYVSSVLSEIFCFIVLPGQIGQSIAMRPNVVICARAIRSAFASFTRVDECYEIHITVVIVRIRDATRAIVVILREINCLIGLIQHLFQ